MQVLFNLITLGLGKGSNKLKNAEIDLCDFNQTPDSNHQKSNPKTNTIYQDILGEMGE
jgi:hypothetical protein